MNPYYGSPYPPQTRPFEGHFPSHSHPPPQKAHVPSDQRMKVHTIFMFNLTFSLKYDDLYNFCAKFGEVLELIYPLTKPGMAFCTYYDLRAAVKAVNEMLGQDLNGRPVKTNFAYKPPAHSKRNLKEICANITAQSDKEGSSSLDPGAVKDALQQFGDIRSCESKGNGAFLVKYFDIRDARKCQEKKEIEIAGEKVKFDFALNVDLGDDGGEPGPPPPHPRHHRHHKGDSSSHPFYPPPPPPAYYPYYQPPMGQYPPPPFGQGMPPLVPQYGQPPLPPSQIPNVQTQSQVPMQPPQPPQQQPMMMPDQTQQNPNTIPSQPILNPSMYQN